MKLAIIDGDVLAFQACKPRWQVFGKAHQEGLVEFRLDSDGNKIPFDWSEDENIEYVARAWQQFESELEIILGKLFTENYVMAVKGIDNYRHLIYPSYKLHRGNSVSEVSQFVPAIRKLAVHNGLAVQADGREADDLMRIWANQARSINLEYIVCTIDKDLKMIPGSHYHIKNQEFFEVSELEALRYYYGQMLSGDPTDHIPGLRGLGPVTAAKMMSECFDEKDMQEMVVGAYIQHYGAEWHDYLLINAKLIHLQNDPEDYFTFKNWPVVKELT